MRTTPETRRRLAESRSWTVEHELLAQLIEEVSVLAADRRRKKPREVPRPAHLKRDREKAGVKKAIAVMKATSRRVYGGGQGAT